MVTFNQKLSSRRDIIRSLGAVGTLSLGVGVTGASSSPRAEIDSATAITEPGKYVLTGDITTKDIGSGLTGILIHADNVDLDGNGHTIQGQDGHNYIENCLRANSVSNVSLHNLYLRNAAHNGADILRCDNIQINSVRTASNNRGMSLVGTSGEIYQSDFSQNGTALLLSQSDSSIKSSSIDSNRRGINIQSSGCEVTGSSITNNGYAIRLHHESTNNRIVGNRICNNESGVTGNVEDNMMFVEVHEPRHPEFTDFRRN